MNRHNSFYMPCSSLLNLSRTEDSLKDWNLSKFYAIFALQTGKVAPLLDSMFTVKIDYSPFLGSTLMRFKMLKLHNLFYLPFTTLTNLLRMGDFTTGWNRHIFMPLIFGQFMLYFGQNKINSIIRSFALASWPCQHHISERASAAARSAASASEHSCNACVYVYRYNVYIQSVYVPEKFWGANNVVPRA